MIDIMSSYGTACSGWTDYGYKGSSLEGSYIYSCTPFPATYNPCSPILSVPPQVYTLDPNWSNCSGGIQAVHDPYSIITTMSGFWPVSSRSTPHDSKTVVASAGASATQDIAIQTATSVTYPILRQTDDLQISKVPPSVTIGAQTFTADSNSAYTVGSKTIRPGDQITVSQSTISLASDGNFLEVDGITQHIDQAYAIGTQTVYEGGPAVTISGTTYSVPSGGSSLVIDGTTEAASAVTGAGTPSNGVQKVWVQVPAYIIDGQTLIAGGTPITSSGTVLSLEPGGESIVIVESRTEDVSVFLASPGSAETSTSGSSSPSSSVEQGDGYSNVTIPTRETDSGAKAVKSGADRIMRLGFELRWLTFISLIITVYQKL